MSSFDRRLRVKGLKPMANRSKRIYPLQTIDLFHMSIASDYFLGNLIFGEIDRNLIFFLHIRRYVENSQNSSAISYGTETF
jgi:hypothetical protein